MSKYMYLDVGELFIIDWVYVVISRDYDEMLSATIEKKLANITQEMTRQIYIYSHYYCIDFGHYKETVNE